MKAKYAEKLREFAAAEGLHVDRYSGNILYGEKNGYRLFLESATANFDQFLLSFSVCRNREMPVYKEIRQMIRGSKTIARCSVLRYQVTFTVRASLLGADKSIGRIRQALKDATRLLRENGYAGCCQNCGAFVETDPYVVGGVTENLCQTCYAAAAGSAGYRQMAEARKQENLVAGIVGAMLGALLGAIVIVLIGQLGFVSALSGIVMAVCTLKGYELLGGKLSGKGIAICVLLMFAMTYVGNRADWAFTIAKYYDVGFMSAYRAFPALLGEDYLNTDLYIRNLVLVYLFVVVGAVPTAAGMMKKKKMEKITYKMRAGTSTAGPANGTKEH